ncbi:MAG: ABC transporter permease [Actinomycetota bacterium]|nr:ABC transporter permease [Actinomycetota bacterium]
MILAGRTRTTPGPLRVVERNVMAYRRMWLTFVSGLVEPLLYLLSIGIGVGALVGDVMGPGGRAIPYDVFVAPGMLAAAAMNGAIVDTTYNFFFKFKYSRTFDAMLSSPLGTTDVAFGEMTWSLLRGTAYAAAFLVAMAVLGLIESAWAVLAIPGAMLTSFAFAGAGMAATTWMRGFVDFDYINVVTIPMFLFSATFFPIERYPGALEWLVRATPLYQGVALERSLVLGDVGWAIVAHAAYLAVMGAVGVRITAARLGRLLQP